MKSAVSSHVYTGHRFIGLVGGAKAWLISQLAQENPNILVACKNRRSAEELFQDLSLFIRRHPLMLFSGWDTIPFENVSPQLDVSAQRLAILDHLLQKKGAIVIAPADALLQKTVTPEFLTSLSFELRIGDSINRDSLTASFEQCGYQRVSLVEAVGEIAMHGSVIDFFPALSTDPLRIQITGEVVTHIRAFDADTQRTHREHEKVRILPVRECVPLSLQPHGRLSLSIERVRERGALLETPMSEVSRTVDAVSSGVHFPGYELIDALSHDKASLFDFLSRECVCVIDDELALTQSLDEYWESVCDREQRLTTDHYLIPTKEQLFLDPKRVREELASFARSYIDHLQVLQDDAPLGTKTRTIRSVAHTELITKLKTKVGSGDAFKPLEQFLTRVRLAEQHVAFVVGSQTRAERLHKILLEINYDAHILSLSGSEWINSPHRYPLVILQGHLSSGFQLPDDHLVFIAEHEIFAERSYRSARKPRTSLKRLLGSLALLGEGDFVVHVDYGVGRYHGLKHLEVEGVESDFLHIEYADSKLFLPVQNIGKIQKFVAAEGQTPALDKLASTRWVKTKLKVKESVATLAGDLIKLYAARSVVKGWRFEPVGAEDLRFAEEFPYDETPDQDKAIEETLSDMALDKPMDRLVCGDVGFGKTEVAVRAAFKCIQHARQVAVLVPTTILAEQHKQTFLSRFSGYPVEVRAVSRFYSAQQNRETITKLQSGEVDIVIGTHRLLSRDVAFNDLGLLIIDEEHRFGVKQKEKLKAFKKQVDVLTLTATPIPRTLHMSLLGIRDISVISTPPHDRRVIRTYIATYEETLIRDAILRELRRGGQSFFIYNKVQSIDGLTAQLAHLIPEARFQFAHGQMSEHELENIMRRFLLREIDVLVCTTIIESGIDIPNANTMIINRADTFGLAQLYQLRGRVGRSDRQAYCYFLVPKSRKLTSEAQKRLKALQALDDLGLGFNLALRDMEIRGAGNLLGKEQSGSVLAVGFELYSKILKEAIFNLKGEEIEIQETIDPEVKLGVPAYIPEHYIPDISERLVLYQRLAAIDSSAEADELYEEILDRFGPLDVETRNLIELMRFRALLRRYGVVKADLNHARLALAFSPKAPLDMDKIMELTKREPHRYTLRKNLTLSISFDSQVIVNPAQLLGAVQEVLERVARAGA